MGIRSKEKVFKLGEFLLGITHPICSPYSHTHTPVAHIIYILVLIIIIIIIVYRKVKKKIFQLGFYLIFLIRL